MKYILKKDLPFAKAGETIEFIEATGLQGMYISGTYKRIEGMKFVLDKLISEGWIEEIKQKEWYEIVGTIKSDFWGYRFYSEEEANTYMRVKVYPGLFRVIKVREVIE